MSQRVARWWTAVLIAGPGLGVLAAEVYATGRGVPGSMAGWAFAYAYYIAPMLASVLLLIAVACVPATFLAGARGSAPRPVTLKVAALAFIAGVALVGAIRAADRLRMYRLERVTAALDAEVRAYTAARGAGHFGAPEPMLNVRGCDTLRVDGARPIGWELRSQCSRGHGAWDHIVFRPNGVYPASERFRRIGRWAYRRD